jgi:hypothetical protein
MRTMSKFLVGAAALVLLAGCTKSNNTESTELMNVDNSGGVFSLEGRDTEGTLQANLLRTAPFQAVVGGVTLKLNTTVMRKYVADEGQPMMAQYVLSANEGEALPNGVKVVEGWLLSATWLWETDVNAPVVSDGTTKEILATAAGGPQWIPGSTVDAVIRVKDANGQAYLIRQADVVITKLEE